MNTVWSDCIQGIGTLYTSRALRFADCFKEEYLNAFSLHEPDNILEIGCGPGALAQSLARWYPQAQIHGIDRDSNFIEFARNAAPELCFSEGDATALPFGDCTFDVTISNTVSEHVDPDRFYAEQRRVLMENGICLVLSARKGISIPAPCIAEETPFEKEIWMRANRFFMDTHSMHGVGRFRQTESELPLSMEQHGFRHVMTDYVVISLTPDHPRYSREMAHAMINANRQNDLDNVDTMLRLAREAVTPDEASELRHLIHLKYDNRIRLYDQGVKQWDTDVSITMIVRGIK